MLWQPLDTSNYPPERLCYRVPAIDYIFVLHTKILLDEPRILTKVVYIPISLKSRSRKMKRKSARSVTISPNVRCQRIYPVQGTNKTVEELTTVGFKLTREQAIHLARVLLAVTQDWSDIDLTGFRSKQRSDGTFSITVTSSE